MSLHNKSWCWNVFAITPEKNFCWVDTDLGKPEDLQSYTEYNQIIFRPVFNSIIFKLFIEI